MPPVLLPDLAATSDALSTALSFGPVITYLVLVCVVLAHLGRCPRWVHPCALALGVPVQVLLQGDLWPLASVAIAVPLFVLGVFVTARMVSGATLFTLVTSVALAPVVSGWLALLVGLLIAGAVSAWRTARAASAMRLAVLGMETMSAVGLSPGGYLVRPDLGRLPQRPAVQRVTAHGSTATLAVDVPEGEQVRTSSEGAVAGQDRQQGQQARRSAPTPAVAARGMALAPYLLVGSSLGCALATLI